MLQLFILSILMVVSYTSPLPVKERINNGVVVKSGEIPYIVSYRYEEYVFCTGSIIDARHIVTSVNCAFAACMYGSEGFAIQYGMLNVNSTENIIEVVETICHEDLEIFDGMRNDIALLTLKSDIPFSTTVKPVVLPQANAPTPAGSPAVLAGWQQVPGELRLLEGDLERIDLKVYSNEDCEKTHSNADRKYHICAGDEQGVTEVCNGDEGTPLYSNGILLGITSWTYFCRDAGQTAVYTNVANYVDWINEKL